MVDVRGAFQQLAFAETYVDTGTGNISVADSFPVCPSFGAVWYRTVDLGFPDVRASVQDNPQRDGTFDETQYMGARQVSVEGVILNNSFGDTPQQSSWEPTVSWNSASYWTTRVSAWASPARRFRFYFTDENRRSRFMDVRGDSFSCPVDGTGGDYREFQLQMVNPSGRIFSFPNTAYDPASTSTLRVTQDGRWSQQVNLVSNNTGRAYALTEPRAYPPGTVGQQAVHYQGSVPVGCLIQFYTGSSSVTAPRITFQDPAGVSRSVGFSSGLVVAAGHTILIDTENRTVYDQSGHLGGATTSIAQYLNAPLQWPQLRPGINLLAAPGEAQSRGYNKITVSASGSPASDAELYVVWYDADLM